MEQTFTLEVPREDAYLYATLIREMPIKQGEAPYQRLLAQLDANEARARNAFIDQAIAERGKSEPK